LIDGGRKTRKKSWNDVCVTGGGGFHILGGEKETPRLSHTREKEKRDLKNKSQGEGKAKKIAHTQQREDH